MRRITAFIGLPDKQASSAATLITKRRRHTHFTIDQLIDARVSAEVIELYRALIAEASKRRGGKAVAAQKDAKSAEADLLPGAVSRLNAFVPERLAQIEHLYQELLAQAEARYKKQVEELSAHFAQTEARYKNEMEQLSAHLAQTEAHPAAADEPIWLRQSIRDTIGTGLSTIVRTVCRAQHYVQAMWLMLQHETANDYVVATAETHSVSEFVEAAFAVVDLSWEKYVKHDPSFDRPTEPVRLVGCAEKILKTLGWKPAGSFAQLVREMVEAELAAIDSRQ